MAKMQLLGARAKIDYSQAVISIAPHCMQSLKPALFSEKSEVKRRPWSLTNNPSRLSSSPAPFDPEKDLPFTAKVSYPNSKSNSATLILLPLSFWLTQTSLLE